MRKGRTSLGTLTEFARFEEDYGTLRKLHASRRNSLGDSGCFACPAFTRFHRDAMTALFDEGRLHLQTMHLDGMPAASIYALRSGDGFLQYQSGMDATRDADRPGWTGVAMALKHAIESGAKFWDFLRGDEPYKASWGARPTPLEHARIAAPGARGALRLTSWTLRDRLRDWWKGSDVARSRADVRDDATPAVETERTSLGTTTRTPDFEEAATR
ncbi:MAG: GNAT family N-acetyltransferase [Pirellulales bacterium]